LSNLAINLVEIDPIVVILGLSLFCQVAKVALGAFYEIELQSETLIENFR